MPRKSNESILQDTARKFDISLQQAQACFAFTRHLKKKQAMLDAGYSAITAAKTTGTFFTQPKIQAAIAWLQERQAKRAMIGSDYVLRGIGDIINEAREGGDHQAALRGLELMGKHLCMWVDKKEVTHKNPFVTSDDPAQREADLARLRRVAAPQLKVVGGNESEN